jgi:hypothetical protein
VRQLFLGRVVRGVGCCGAQKFSWVMSFFLSCGLLAVPAPASLQA